jgi:hypothetical protein
MLNMEGLRVKEWRRRYDGFHCITVGTLKQSMRVRRACRKLSLVVADVLGTGTGSPHYCIGQRLEDETMKLAFVLVAAAGIGLAIPPANAEDARVGVGVGPVGAGVTVGESHDRDRDRDRTTVIKKESEPREHTTVIKKEHEEPSSKTIIKDRD